MRDGLRKKKLRAKQSIAQTVKAHISNQKVMSSNSRALNAELTDISNIISILIIFCWYFFYFNDIFKYYKIIVTDI